MPPTNKYLPCPCQSKQLYSKCCKPFHDGAALPATPEQLMRSRFSAYALHNADYVMDTTHPENPAYTKDRSAWKESILSFCHLTQFNGLQISESTDEHVTFTAILQQQGKDAGFTERSKFVKVNDRWLYQSGEFIPRKDPAMS